jgi:hypothetical protein
MKKILLLVAGFVALYAFLNTGNTSTTNDLKHSDPSYSSTQKNQFLSSPKSAPVLVPLPGQSKPSKTLSGSVQNESKPSSDSSSKPLQADNSNTSANPTTDSNRMPQDNTQTTCDPDHPTTCPDQPGTDQPATNTGTTSGSSTPVSCDLSDPSVPIQQFQDNGTIVCR